MKAIMISIKPEWCVKIMNGDKTIEVRKNEALANAIKKLIDENGFANIYVYCSKAKLKVSGKYGYKKELVVNGNVVNGKVAFKFRCYKVDDYVNGRKWSWKVGAPMWGACNDYEYILKDACLTDDELRNYADDLSFIAIHITNLEIFDKPKELSEFYTLKCDQKEEQPCNIKDVFGVEACYHLCKKCKPFTRAPQNFCYLEVE